MGRACWIAVVVCLSVLCRDTVADDFNDFSAADPKKVGSCLQVCQGVGVDPSLGCRYAPESHAREEVVVVTQGDSDIRSWDWDSVSMVVSSFFSSTHKNGLAACVAHSKGKRYGLRESVHADRDEKKFTEMLKVYQDLLMVDHMVFDLLDAFTELETAANKTATLATLTRILSSAKDAVRKAGNKREVFCVVPWQPPCDDDCSDVEQLLKSCEVLLMSPDSYMPKPENGKCVAGATVPVTKFLYGIERYVSLQKQPVSIVAGIPWHGYAYTCMEKIPSGGRCLVKPKSNTTCFDSTNRERQSLSQIHNTHLIEPKLDNLNQAMFANLNDTTQLWYENFTTLYVKYSLVKDLKLRGLSIWYGEDITFGASEGKLKFAFHSWDFLTQSILQKAVFNPPKTSHYYADTVAGVAVGCLLLGTALGVTFTCIGFRRGGYRGRSIHRPFKLDEDMDGYRDDEGL